MPRVRQRAVTLIRQGWSTRKVARHLGFNQSTIVRWAKRAPENRRLTIPTRSSRPHHHPHELSNEMIDAIISYREKHKRCSEVIHHLLAQDGYIVSLSSVKRTLKRYGLIQHNPYKRYHKGTPRPAPEAPGILVQIDTIHIGPHPDQFYVYTLLDVCSRWTHALVSERINTWRSLLFVGSAQKKAVFRFKTLQSDHGQEFSTWFTEHVWKHGYVHRHSRVRTPSDNGHLERFNRTIQDECFKRVPQTPAAYRRALPEYLHWYNTKRPHMGLKMKSPIEVMRSY
jgi:transposase InsO family protein